jgi:hypothetical protein
MVRYCSRGCENSNPSHRALCIPSVTPAQSFSIIIEGDCPEGIQDDVAILFTADSTIRSPPSVASSQCVHINPYNFVTLRLWKDTSKLVSFSFSPFADIRFAMVGSRPFKWYSPREVNHFYLSQGSSQFVLVAPGRQMLADLIARRSLPNGVERKSLELPDDDLIQYAQSAEPEKNKTMLAFVMIEWSI